ncbi:hypothetical protein HOE67_02290 [Candidatus Peregrinibacteria bacterium]|jgi:hypothetical protein|nr:hypothetical protein [Candidatus Peregrinibacteria bacterium]MBT4055918.1 hypothetical protein [Candidatus Peregrinibacteria bacterium]
MSFIKDFQKLYWASPVVKNWTRQSENCEYGDICVVSKNCFLCFNSSNLENCYYCYSSRKNYDCNGLMFCEHCTMCYECMDCHRCNNSDHCQDCDNCANCQYCYDCKSCNDCFGCASLMHKKHHIFNKKHSKEEYEERLKEIQTWPQEKIEEEFEKVKISKPRCYMHQTKCTNCIGDYVEHSKNCYWIFDSRDCEDSFYIMEACLEHGCKDCADCGPIANSFEQCYDVCFAGYLNNCHHIYWADYISDCDWCTSIWDCRKCFGCIYMKNKEYCILNKKYSEKEYEELTKKYKKELLDAGIQDLYSLIHYKC